ncbi:unnamed protein product, partial [Brenthis ino]
MKRLLEALPSWLIIQWPSVNVCRSHKVRPRDSPYVCPIELSSVLKHLILQHATQLCCRIRKQMSSAYHRFVLLRFGCSKAFL